MYTPKANLETRLPVLHEAMTAHPLAAVVTLNASGLQATHLPIFHELDGSEFGVLRGHVSRANPQWKDISATIDALAIFGGPQHYISAGWYPGKMEHGKEVPTWNYIAVHAYGPLRIVQDADWLLAHLTELTDAHEAGLAQPWSVADAPRDWIAGQMKGIVGYELPIRRLEGRWKLSQNRDERDRDAVMRELVDVGTESSRMMERLVRKTLT